MVALDNFEMSTYRLSSDCSSSELQGKLAREPGIEPGTTESKSVVLPLHHSRTKTWHTPKDSNLDKRFWRPLCCHYIRDTFNIWWTVTGSNRSLRLAKPSCPQQHLQPIHSKTHVYKMCFRMQCIATPHDRVVPCPGVLLPVLSPLDSCVLSARFRTV